jgi:antitoxin component YwqK of YwqJK toxin-antitoxin module
MIGFKNAIVALLLLAIIAGCDKRETRETKYDNGILKERYTVIKDKNGAYIKDGKYSKWYDNNQKQYETTYKVGKEDGRATSWYKNGQKQSETAYTEGKEEGHYIGWYINGKKESETIYKNGEDEGLRTHWDENGKQISVSRCYLHSSIKNYYPLAKGNWWKIVSLVNNVNNPKGYYWVDVIQVSSVEDNSSLHTYETKLSRNAFGPGASAVVAEGQGKKLTIANVVTLSNLDRVLKYTYDGKSLLSIETGTDATGQNYTHTIKVLQNPIRTGTSWIDDRTNEGNSAQKYEIVDVKGTFKTKLTSHIFEECVIVKRTDIKDPKQKNDAIYQYYAWGIGYVGSIISKIDELPIADGTNNFEEIEESSQVPSDAEVWRAADYWAHNALPYEIESKESLNAQASSSAAELGQGEKSGLNKQGYSTEHASIEDNIAGIKEVISSSDLLNATLIDGNDTMLSKNGKYKDSDDEFAEYYYLDKKHYKFSTDRKTVTVNLIRESPGANGTSGTQCFLGYATKVNGVTHIRIDNSGNCFGDQ